MMNAATSLMNRGLIAHSTDTVATGNQIVIPPVHGVVVTTKGTDTVDSLATKYSVDPQTIIDFNRLRTTTLTPGMTLVIPGGVGGAFPPPPAIFQIVHSGISSNFAVRVLNCCLGPYVNNKFPVVTVLVGNGRWRPPLSCPDAPPARMCGTS